MFPTIDPEGFRAACARWATGVTVAAACGADGSPHGLTVSSFAPVSLEPPLVLICIDHAASTLPYFRNGAGFGVSILNAAQQHLSSRFARMVDRERFSGVAWHAGLTGVPLLDGALATFECRTTQVIEAGDHTVFIAEVAAADTGAGDPLLYFGGAYRGLAGPAGEPLAQRRPRSRRREQTTLAGKRGGRT